VKIKRIDIQNLVEYEELFSVCFPKSNLKSDYLKWLYFSNPLGDVVGFDATIDNVVVAHCAFIPTRVGGSIGLLSLNVATHPSYQSQGLFQKLVKHTIKTSNKDYDFIVGVANAQSAKTFIKRLGFVEIGRLNLRFGELHRSIEGSRTWTMEDINWRVTSPRQKMQSRLTEQDDIEISMHPRNFPFKIRALIHMEDTRNSHLIEKETKKHYGFTIDWNKGSKPWIRLPERLKPSPLVMIYLSLNGNEIDINSWSFPDFDAF
jgi:GNAT superfamily N-acetyltransferase